jgi:hypothetical protein
MTQAVMAGGQVLEPGTYEMRLTGEHVDPLPGQSADAEQVVEFVKDGRGVARDVAQVVPGPTSAVGTSGGASSPARVERLKADDFVRVSMNREGERFLVFLPIAGR